MTEVSPVTTTEVYGKCINMQTALVHDKSGTSSIILFDMNCNRTKNNSSYIFTNLSFSKYLSLHLLKTTEVTTIEETSMEDINLDSRQCGNKQTVICKFVSVDLDILRGKLLCSKCKSEITIDDGLTNCEKCCTLSV